MISRVLFLLSHDEISPSSPAEEEHLSSRPMLPAAATPEVQFTRATKKVPDSSHDEE